MDRLAALPPSLRDCLRDFVTRWRRLVELRAAGTALSVFIVWTLLACAADRWLHLPGVLREGLLIAGALAAFATALFRLLPLRGPIDWVSMAGVIEEYDPRFQQRLITVTSRVLGSPEHRGSDEILSHLLREVGRIASAASPAKLLSIRSAAASWAPVVAALLIMLGLARISAFGQSRLLARYLLPLSNLPPVTTTELSVTPGNVDVFQSDALRIDVTAQNLGASPVWVFLNDDDANWSRYTMDDAGGGRFSFTLNAVGRDVRYYVAGGDATSRQYSVRVKRPPAVAEFRIHYTYPAYTGKSPSTASNVDGAIEAPAGAEALLTVIATEPLEAALLTIGDQKILMDPTADVNVRQATLQIQRDATYVLDLISAREVRGGGPGKMAIHATADRPPLVRLLQAGQTLRLNPRDTLPLSYLAMDDYALKSVELLAEVNAQPPLRIPFKLAGDRRRQEETIDFDLASMPLNIGDLLTLTVTARDTAGQEASSDELRVLLSPRSIDLDAHERIDEFSAAARFASTLAEELEAAGKAIAESDVRKDHQSAAYLTASANGSRHLSGASEAATLLRQSLLRGTAHSDSPELSTALSGWIDSAQRQSQSADDLFRRGGSPDGMGEGAIDKIRRAIEQSRELYGQIRTIAVGERAAAVLADRENIKATQHKAPAPDDKAAERFAAAIQRCREDITAGAADIGINAASKDADAQLQSRIDAERAAAQAKQGVDFASVARDWSQSLQHDPHQWTGLEARLATAAQAEAVRKDADLIRARDLELASRAATALAVLAGQTPPGKSPQAGPLKAFADAMAVLQREHALNRQSPGAHSGEETRTIRNAARRARDDMARWSGETNPPKNAIAAFRPADFESLAMRAGAEAARHDYKRAAEQDKALTQRLNESARKPAGRTVDGDSSPAATQIVDEHLAHIQRAAEAVARHMAAAETIDRLTQSQDKLVQEARSTKIASSDLVGRQRRVAEEIADVERQRMGTAFPTTARSGDIDDPAWRGQATASLLFAQEQLSAMPQALAAAQESAGAARKAGEKAIAVRAEATNASLDRQAMLMLSAEQAERDAQDAVDRSQKALGPVSPQAANDLADRLAPFVPEASAAREAITGPLSAALGAVQLAGQKTDENAVNAAAADTRKAIDLVQKELARAQEVFVDRDPLVAAKWFAMAAVQSLAHHPNDLRAAMTHQANVSLALSRAWDNSVHRAAELRLSSLPSLQAVYGPPPPISASDSASAAALSPNLGGRDWARARAINGDDFAAAVHDFDPPGYEEPLRLYFETLGKAQEKTR